MPEQEKIEANSIQLQAFFDIFVRATLALERIAMAQEELLAMTVTSMGNSNALLGNLLGDTNEAFKAMGLLKPEEEV